jgi:exodeoxyribonuclease V gamma subunit
MERRQGPAGVEDHGMALEISYVERLEHVVDPVIDFLRRDRDLFARPRIVVPTAGAKAWLWSELARRLGASGGGLERTGRGDGIVANVEISYPATISALLEPDDLPAADDDPWDVENLTFTILAVIARNPDPYAPIVSRLGGPLLAARRFADRFDHYQFRRPGMILGWDAGRAIESPYADAEGQAVAKPLAPPDRWQFNLWREVRRSIGRLPHALGPRDRSAGDQSRAGAVPDGVLVAGLQGLSLHQIGLLKRLGDSTTRSGAPCDVRVVLVHPSPALRHDWASRSPPESPGVAPQRLDDTPDDGVDPLVEAWLRGTREAQWLLASQGERPVHAGIDPPAPLSAGAPLLARLRQTVAAGRVSGGRAFDDSDASVRIHRCHDLGRQAEVLHDAIAQAFRTLDGLAPHDVVIVSPQIANLAPHLEATFNRAVPTGDATVPTIELPLLVADRGIREVSRGASLLASLVELVGSRCSVDGMLAVAAHPLVLQHFGLDDDDTDVWRRCIERTKVRWGLDADRRTRAGLDRADLSAHTWRLGIERMLLGAVVPDGRPEPVLGAVVPLNHVAAADIESLAPLVTIFGIIDDLDRQAGTAKAVPEWCDLLESALGQLAGEDNDELAVPLGELENLRRPAAAAAQDSAAVAVPYHDVRTILAATLAAPVGRQPLRTGVITATSMIPFRGVPFRVICLAGFDDEAVAAREGDSEDLAGRHQLLGDADPRVDIRRGLLDCVLAAADRLVITCTGMDVKNNAPVPLVTPLAEFVDFATRHDVPLVQRNDATHSAIEVFHPRHACSRANFLTGRVVTAAEPWSHDAAALAAARALGEHAARAADDGAPLTPPTHVECEWLAEFMRDPLWPYVRKTLDINPWRDDDTTIPATLPLHLEDFQRRTLRNDYLDDLLATGDRAAFTRAWAAACKANGDVPVLGFGDDAIAEIEQFAASLLETADAKRLPLGDRHEERLSLMLDGITLSGTIDRWYVRERTAVLLCPEARTSLQFTKPKMLAAVLLLAARATDLPLTQVIAFNQHEDWHPGAVRENGSPLPAAQMRSVKIADGIDAARARRVLSELCDLYRRAAARPCAAFGGVGAALTTDEAGAREAFESFTTNARYAQSLECVVHGQHPAFADAFADAPSMAEFFRRYTAVRTFTGRYTYAPE